MASLLSRKSAVNIDKSVESEFIYRQSSVKKPTSKNTSSNNTFLIQDHKETQKWDVKVLATLLEGAG